MWTSVVRDLLLKPTADEALEALLEADLAGGHSFLIMDAGGVGHVVEAMPTARPFESLGDHALVHTNHTVHPDASAVEGPKPEGLMASSSRRLARATELLDRTGITSDDLMALTRDPDSICQVSSEPFHIESSGGAVMRPRTLDFWAVWGVPSQNEYVHVSFGG
jgi:hypothetical protein